jgi:hypothetical protein
MEKIAIVGPSGAGKTTLAKKIGAGFRMKVYHLDRFFWQPSWRRETSDVRIDILQNLVREPRWIIEGTYLNTSELHLCMADTIIFSDTPSLVCLLRLIKRHNTYRGHSRRDIPVKSTDKLTFLILLQVLAFPLGARRKLEDKLRKFPPEKVIRLHSTKEVNRFLAQLETYINEMRQSSSALVNEKSPVLARE